MRTVGVFEGTGIFKQSKYKMVNTLEGVYRALTITMIVNLGAPQDLLLEYAMLFGSNAKSAGAWFSQDEAVFSVELHVISKSFFLLHNGATAQLTKLHESLQRPKRQILHCL